ncbi:lysophospholipid acyltransferase family protein [Halosquirtibacter laminarini]|uniref:Lysophospholipid acyltransferase family protein n=1 Tax=Halosquirtibacter laminarini TaxID=3374600 RepID=A0AC61NN79_9BACT|nr:lysophospholipid acyltransferase family protein [Prolixibacteraceae bacterium]
MNQVQYMIIRGLTRIANIFPLRVHYFFSNLFYYLTYYIVRYRRGVVRTNLTNSFPDKDQKEILEIEKKFYRHLVDMTVETLYFSDISTEEVKKRVHIINPELLQKYIDQGRQIIVSVGHHNNWEWISCLKLSVPTSYLPVYKPLHNKAFDKFYLRLRSRLGAEPIPKNKIFKRLYNDYRLGIPSISGFINDQSPKKQDIQYWTTFLNQDTPIFLGVEKIAKKLDSVVVTAEITKPERGHYNVQFDLITKHAKDEEQYVITEKDTKHLEKTILKNPEFWLWTHKRWKHQRNS